MININYTNFSLVDIITLVSLVFNIIFAIPTLTNKLKSINRRKAIKKLLEFDKVIIHIPCREDKERLKPVIAMEDYNTYENIKGILEKNAFNVSIKYISQNGEIEIEKDKSNIVICGPKNSSLIKKTFESINGLSFINEDGTWFFLDENTNNKIYSPMDQNPPQNKDIAFLGKLSIYSKPNQSVLLICGIHAIGSLGIANFLNNKNELDALLKKVKNKRFYSIISSSYSENDKKVYNSTAYFEAREII
ncbi:hypothetical protein [Clostridium botulinum]|uniref:hypothetical protein n=1 Tax=Clostridium botulinum TaxID=1491 RepID=UPI0007739F4C|nr:hypothetical protein [Clostridium botulinum]NFF79731.1 hypothetical protein [Clostridium botulinum]